MVRAKCRCPAVGEIVAVDRSHDDMRKPKLGDRVTDARGLVFVQRTGQAGAHIAEGAGAGAGVAHDHEGGVALVPAFADVGTARLLAYGRELEFAHEAQGLGEHRRAGRAHADPGRLAGDRLVRPVRLLGMARAQARPRFGQVDEPGHGRYVGLARGAVKRCVVNLDPEGARARSLAGSDPGPSQ